MAYCVLVSYWDNIENLEFSARIYQPQNTSLEFQQCWFNKACKLIDSVYLDSILTDNTDFSLLFWQQRVMSIMEECILYTTVITSDRNSSTPWYPKILLNLYRRTIDCTNRKECLLPLWENTSTIIKWLRQAKNDIIKSSPLFPKVLETTQVNDQISDLFPLSSKITKQVVQMQTKPTFSRLLLLMR